MMKKITHQPRILYTAKLSLKSEREIKTSPMQTKGGKSSLTEIALRRIFETVIQVKGK